MTAACNLEFAGLTAKGCVNIHPSTMTCPNALQISGNSNLPAYRNGDAIIVFPKATVMRGRSYPPLRQVAASLFAGWIMAPFYPISLTE